MRTLDQIATDLLGEVGASAATWASEHAAIVAALREASGLGEAQALERAARMFESGTQAYWVASQVAHTLRAFKATRPPAGGPTP